MKTIITESRGDGTVIQRGGLNDLREVSLDKLLMGDENLVMWDIGNKITAGKVTSTQAVRFFVEMKLPKSSIPPEKLLPEYIERLPTDVIEFERLTAPEPERAVPRDTDRKSKQRPFPGGVSGGNTDITAGTYAMKFFKDGRPVIFTNAHVGASNPFTDVSKQNTRNRQQGTYDGGGSAEDMGDMINMVLLEEDYPAFNDACLVEPDERDVMLPTILEVGSIAGFLPGDQLAVGDEVWKSGRTTGLTKGYITAIGSSAKVGYGEREVLHKYCVVTSDMSDGGDSGSVMLIKRNGLWYIWGYLFAGSSQATVCHTFDNVRSIWGLTLPEGETPVPDNTVLFDFALSPKNPGPNNELWTLTTAPGMPVRDSVSGQSITGALVEVKCGVEIEAVAYTDNGLFSLEVESGTYTIYCTHPEYFGQQRTFMV